MTPDVHRRAIESLSSGGRVLVTRLQYLGDVILTLPVLHALKDRFPEAPIDYLARSPGADVLAGEPLVSRVIKVPAKGAGVRAWTALVRDLRRREYAVAIDLYSNPRSALLTWLSGAGMRIGGARRVRKNLYTHAIKVPGGVRSAIDHHFYHLRPLDISANPTKPALNPTRPEREAARDKLRSLGLDPDVDKVVGIHPGGKWEVKRWPVESFVALARRIAGVLGARIAVIVGPGEEGYQNAVRERLGAGATYLPVLPVREAAAVVAALDAMVVADGGLMHVSVAVGTPTVGIFGSSEPDIWFPYESFGAFVPAFAPIWCRPCHFHTCAHVSCLRRLSVETVVTQLLGVMGAAGREARPAG